jgi:hypothetical protein
MTVSATETAILALVGVLNASASLPDVRRDPVFDDAVELLAEDPSIGRILVVRTGVPISSERAFGMPNDQKFELVRNVDVEFFAGGKEGDALFAKFDADVMSIFDAIEADRTLGGVVSIAEIVEQPEISAEPAGAIAVLTALIRVQLTYVSPRAY